MKKNSFTIVELLIVIVIIGILVTLAVPQYNKLMEKAKWSKTWAVLGAINKACEIYYMEKGFYPYGDNEIYLNGPARNAANGLLVDVPSYPDATEFLYGIEKKWFFQVVNPWKIHRCGVFAFIDQGAKNGTWEATEPYWEIFVDGWRTEEGAPGF